MIAPGTPGDWALATTIACALAATGVAFARSFRTDPVEPTVDGG